MTRAYPEAWAGAERNLVDRAALRPREDDTMNSDKDKQPESVERSEAKDDAIKDEGWSKVDLHEQKNTPDADTRPT